MFHPSAVKFVSLAPKLAFVFIREAAAGLVNACDVVIDQARIELYGLSAGASPDEFSARRQTQVKDEVLRRAVKIAGDPMAGGMSKDDLVNAAIHHSGG